MEHNIMETNENFSIPLGKTSNYHEKYHVHFRLSKLLSSKHFLLTLRRNMQTDVKKIVKQMIIIVN